ncbi:MAG: acyl-CoA dehydrogenase family protein [Myxococcota bacterium]
MISFEPSDEQKAIVDAVRRLVEKEIRPQARPCDLAEKIPPTLLDSANSLGLVMSVVPEKNGGGGEPLSAVTGALIAEELAWGDLALAAAVLSPSLHVMPLVLAGSDAQKEKYLPAFLEERFAPGAIALAEPSFRFDARRPATTATREGDGYVLAGRKCFVPVLEGDTPFLVFALEGDRVQGFFVPRNAEGLKIEAGEKNMGLFALPTAELALEKVRVSAGDRLGEDAGCDFGALLDRSRVGLSAMAVGVARAALEYSKEYAKERTAFGVPIATKQAIAFMLAEMAIEVDAARLLVWEAAWRIDEGLDATKEVALARRTCAATALEVADRAVQILGGHGYIREHLVELHLRNARGFNALEALTIV